MIEKTLLFFGWEDTAENRIECDTYTAMLATKQLFRAQGKEWLPHVTTVVREFNQLLIVTACTEVTQ